MTRHKTFKRDVRTRMEKTGERYTAARRQLIQRADQAPTPEPLTSPATDPELLTSEEAMRGATGRGWDEWFAILDAWRATERNHTEIARWLVDEHGVGGWWAQSVTVGYERARGIRQKHQTSAGFAVSVNKTIGASAERLAEAFTDPGVRQRWLPGTDLRERTSRPGKSARFDWADDGSRVVVDFVAKGEHRAQAAVQHEKLPDAPAAERTKVFWRERLSVLKDLLEGER
ncbi:MAG: DUF4287 domain-containing protein [Chloroflexota bacterium]|nr:DUF4287 domain-containing protein [Chloroflexota bacterium]